MYHFDLLEVAQFKEKAPAVQIIAQSAHARYVLFSLRAEQEVREHSTSSQIAVQVLTGKLLFAAAGEKRLLEPGQLLLLEANKPHSLQARTDAVLLLTITPDPQQHTMATELFEKIKPIATLS